MEWDKVAFDRWLTTEPEEEDVNIINELTAENAKLRDLLSRAADIIADLSSGGRHLVIMQEIDSWLTDNAD